MKNFRLLPILVLVIALVPLLLFLGLATAVFNKSIKNTIVNDPEDALIQSLNAFQGTYNSQFVNTNLLYALHLSGQEVLQKSISGSVPAESVINTFGLSEAKSSHKDLIVITDKKGSVLYDNLGIPKPTPSPTSSTPSGKRKTSKSKITLHANIQNWAGTDRALKGLNTNGIFFYQGTPYLAAMVPIQGHKQTLGVVMTGNKIDQTFWNSLKIGAGNEIAFFSQGLTFCTKSDPLPPLDFKKLTYTGNPVVQWQKSTYLVGVITFDDLDNKPMGFSVVFQPIKQILTIEGSPQKDIFKTALLLIFLTLISALALLWQFMAPFNKLLMSVDQITKGDFNVSLPLSRPDELGHMARSLKEMIEGLREKDRISLVLGKVVDPQAAKKILADKDYFALKGERRECTLLQADLKGFNTLSENMSPEALVEALNRYFSIINEVIFKYEGMVDKFIGETAIAIWGAPFTHEDKEFRAVKSALEIQQALRDFNISRIKTGHPPFTVGIGIHTGLVVSGNLGSDKHYDYSIIGEPLHVVNRLCSMAAPGQTVVSEETYEKTQSLVKANPLNPIAVKGSLTSLKTFEIKHLI